MENESLVTQIDSLDHSTTVHLKGGRMKLFFLQPPDLTDWISVQTGRDWTTDLTHLNPETWVWEDGGEAGEHTAALLREQRIKVLFDLWTNKTLGEEVKVTLTPHWTTAAPTATLRRLTRVYFKKEEF